MEKTNIKSSNALLEKSFRFSIDIILLYKSIKEVSKEYVLSKQILRSGTSIGAMIREAQNTESHADFTHKLAIAQKETDETIYWLELLKETDFIQDSKFQLLNYKANELLRIIKSSILTVKQRHIRN